MISGRLCNASAIKAKDRWAARRQRLLGELKCSLVGESQRGGKLREGGLQIILRLHQQQLRLRQIHIRKTDVQAGFEFIFLQLGDLIGNQTGALSRFPRATCRTACAFRQLKYAASTCSSTSAREVATFSSWAFACRFELFTSSCVRPKSVTSCSTVTPSAKRLVR